MRITTIVFAGVAVCCLLGCEKIAPAADPIQASPAAVSEAAKKEQERKDFDRRALRGGFEKSEHKSY